MIILDPFLWTNLWKLILVRGNTPDGL